MKALITFLAVTLVSFAADAPPPPKAEEVAKSYKTLDLLNPKPIVTKVPSTLCIPPPITPPGRRLGLQAGPHKGAEVNHYRNLLAQMADQKTFLPGSVLVKEKLANDVNLTTAPGLGFPDKEIADRVDQRLQGADMLKAKMTALAGMIKRPAGTLPKSGDWEFFWFEDGKVTTTGMESCAGCHSGAKKDYVFTDFPGKAGK